MKIGELFLLLVISQSVCVLNGSYKPLDFDKLYQQYSTEEGSVRRDNCYHEQIDHASFPIMQAHGSTSCKKAESDNKQVSFSVMQAHGSNSVNPDIMPLYSRSNSQDKICPELVVINSGVQICQAQKKNKNDNNAPIGRVFVSNDSIVKVEERALNSFARLQSQENDVIARQNKAKEYAQEIFKQQDRMKRKKKFLVVLRFQCSCY